VELHGGDGLAVVPQALVRSVIHIAEVGAPRGGQRGLVNGVPVVLGGDHTLASHEVERRLVVAAVPVLQLVRARAGRQAQQQVAHADPEGRNRRALVDQPTQARNSRPALARVARPVGDEDSIKLLGLVRLGEVSAPWQQVHLRATLGQGADDVVLGATVHQSNHHVATRVVHTHSLGGHLSHKVLEGERRGRE